MTELNANMARGSRHLATKSPDILEEKLNRDVKFGCSVLVWVSSLRDIQGTMVQVCGLVVQHALKGIKYRLTHDLSFSITSEDASVNIRCDMAAYLEMIYGFCLSYTISLKSLFEGSSWKRALSSVNMTSSMRIEEWHTEPPLPCKRYWYMARECTFVLG